MTTTEPGKNVHHGRNIKRFREMFGLKQEALALELGDDWSQKKVSRLEENEIVEDQLLEQISKVLKVPVEAIKSFDEQAAIQIISNTFNDEASAYNVHFKCTFNPLDKVVELYERMLQSEKEKVDILQKMLDEKK